MSNWRFVREGRIITVKMMYEEYKTKGRVNRDYCYRKCVTTCCRESDFTEYMDKKCANNDCVSCWEEFMEFLDIKPKRNNLEVYSNAE